MPEKINLKLYDVDGCLYHAFRQDTFKAATGPEDWLLKTNEEFLKQEVKRIIAKGFTKLIIAFGTNRQDYGTDLLNTFKNTRPSHTCVPLLPILQSYFSNHVNCKVVLEPFLMADLYHDIPGGTSYLAMLKDIYVKKSQDHKSWVFDDNKVSLIYAYAHRTASLHASDDSIVLDFVEDKKEILSYLNKFYSNAPDLLPKNVTLRLIKYWGKDIKLVAMVVGKGNIDPNYHWSVRFLATRALVEDARGFSIEEASKFFAEVANDRTIDTIEGLEQFHAEMRYFIPGYTQMKFEQRFEMIDLDSFRKIRPRIARMPVLEIYRQSGYTTAEELRSKGLIPRAFVIPKITTKENHLAIEVISPTPITPTTPLLSEYSDSEETTLTIAVAAQNKIIAELNNYIAGRGRVDLKDYHLNWISRHFRNNDLTRAKIKLAHEFKEKVSLTTSLSELKLQLEAYQDRHVHLEEEHNKTYGCLTKSGLGKNLYNIEKILLSETARPRSFPSRRILS